MAGRILIVDDMATNRIVLKVKLAEARYTVLLAATGQECLAQICAALPDMVLLDWSLPDMSGQEILRCIRGNAATRDLPVIVMLTDTASAVRLDALESGADDVIHKPIDGMRLMARLRALQRSRDGIDELRTRDAGLGVMGLAEPAATFDVPGLVALVMHRPEAAMNLRNSLRTHVGDHLLILTRDEALAETTRTPDAYVLECGLGDDDEGLDLLSDLRCRGNGRHAAICVMLPNAAKAAAAMAFDLGANEVLPSDADPREIGLRLQRLVGRKRHEDRLRESVTMGLRLAAIDPLTGLHNRRYALAELGRLLDRSRTLNEPLAVMVVDLDRFKAVNDAFGHAAGDSVLIEVARRLTADLRGTDLVARIGGEEFLVALPATALSKAGRIARHLCRVIEETPIKIDAQRALSVTVSIGLAVHSVTGPGCTNAVATIVASADQALLASKARGRNQVTISRSAA